MNTSGFDQYYDEAVEPGRRERAYAWATARTKTADSKAGLHRKLPIGLEKLPIRAPTKRHILLLMDFRADRVPRFSSDATDFYVVLPNLNYGVKLEDFRLAANTKTITKTSTKTITKEDAVITKDAWAVLQIIRENPSVSAEEIGARLGLTRAGAIYHMNKLKAIAKLRRVGTPRNGHWEVM